ncbi:bZIP transcription factor 11-like [Olea europaea subsp. europaea]|uniref:BZIP transcription factor 11-like n=1 Tax=Olea europaea subsp. europaea TaxID=158383 RepID=A0A8S0S7W1_OLEEU|nr:bZIP transcription factor 11-like [Olea europaea subsp. europaea]
MGSSSGNSSGSSQILNSGSEEDLMDQRKRKRMQSNRESAKRSRMRKQKHLDELTAKSAQIQKENSQLLTSINITTQNYMNIEAENSVIRARITELSQRLQSLNEIIATAAGGGGATTNNWAEESFMNSPWNLMYFSQQPIVASSPGAFNY